MGTSTHFVLNRIVSRRVVSCRPVFERPGLNWRNTNPAYRRSRPTFCIPQGYSMIVFRDSEAVGDSKLDVLVRVLYAVALNRIVSIGVVSYSERAKRARSPPRCLLYLSQRHEAWRTFSTGNASQ